MHTDMERICFAIERPDRSLLNYYILTSLLLGPLFFVLLIPLYFRGVDNAEAIRDIVREGVRRQKDSGLGDPDEPVHAPHSGAEELLAEARLTRQMLERLAHVAR